MTTIGVKVVLCAPSTVLPHSLASSITHCKLRSVGTETNIESALARADVVMPLRLEIEQQQNGLLPTLQKYAQLSPIAGGKNK
jgi:aspartate carbamoyltransferase catalytic subunit